MPRQRRAICCLPATGLIAWPTASTRSPQSEKADDPAGAGFQALVAPRECDEALIERHLDVAAQILGMDQAFGKGVAMQREHVSVTWRPDFLCT
jgi:hypothetical protein